MRCSTIFFVVLVAIGIITSAIASLPNEVDGWKRIELTRFEYIKDMPRQVLFTHLCKYLIFYIITIRFLSIGMKNSIEGTGGRRILNHKQKLRDYIPL